jgi:hypothetical protein
MKSKSLYFAFAAFAGLIVAVVAFASCSRANRLVTSVKSGDGYLTLRQYARSGWGYDELSVWLSSSTLSTEIFSDSCNPEAFSMKWTGPNSIEVAYAECTYVVPDISVYSFGVRKITVSFVNHGKQL